MTASRVKCVIFDCEGTLVDSERLCCEALVQVFGELGVALSYSQVVEHFAGGKIADVLHSTCQFAHISADIDLLEQRYRAVVAEMFQRQLVPMSGAQELLDYLQHHQIEFCAVSNAPREKIALTLSLAGLERYFQGRIFSAFDANSWKPEPDLIRYCAMNMGFTLEECIYIDDTAKGVAAGINAGVITFQLSPLNPQNRSRCQQVIVLAHLQQLVQWLSDRQSPPLKVAMPSSR
ncbi:HAD family hydrolase [Vibrio misgurnus]|uniref:HAD family hydrolase n=1 Tax=Vibrio misgurnus TaxID=2993714 RepID=UPI002415F53B|nr:HAD family hydrolase [Vibrio sp. gvc]